MPKTALKGVLALDLGTSSVRAVVYDIHGRMVESTLCDLPYKVRTVAPGEVSSDPDELVDLIARSIDLSVKAARKANVEILAAGASCYWHSLMGVDRSGKPTTELLTWADTRSAAHARTLRDEFDEHEYHGRTGCFFHASYWPAKLRWLKASRSGASDRTTRWVSLGEYLYGRLVGDRRVSISIASGTGLLDVHRSDWDEDALRMSRITATELSPLADWDESPMRLQPTYAKRWPQLRDVPWFLPLGDGALANVGANSVSPKWFCATIGTSSALRVVMKQTNLAVPWGAFVYRLDRERYVLGGALSEGGNVVRWFTDTLGLGHKKALERAAFAIAPDGHGLTVLPFWAGERSPNWRGDARAAFTGLSLSTKPADLLRAAIEGISYQFVAVATAMRRVVDQPEAVIATGGQLLNSPPWTQMLADCLNLRVTASSEAEASSRGAALLALNALGALPGLWSLQPARGRSHQPRKTAHAIYEKARERQERLYELLYPPQRRGA